MKINKYTDMDYSELLCEINKAKLGRECRQIHRELKKYDKNIGLPLWMRYPKVTPAIISVITSTITFWLLKWLLKEL